METKSVHLRSYPSNLSPWPPKPLERFEDQACKAAGMHLVSFTFCTNINTSPGRNDICKGCTCPWRVCSACSMQHAVASDMRDIDPATGLCGFHTARGKAAVRPEVQEAVPVLPKFDLSVLASNRSAEKEEHTKKGAQKTETNALSLEITHIAEYETQTERSTLARYADLARAECNPRRITIMKYLAAGLTPVQIGALLGTTSGSINAGALLTAKVLMIRISASRGSKAAHVRAILADTYRYMCETKIKHA